MGMLNGYGTYIIIGLVIAWIAQLGLSLWQMRRFYKRRGELRKVGRVSVGLAGSTYKGKIYTIISVDENDRVVVAEELSGITVFANLKPVDQVVGMSLQDLLEEEPSINIKKKTWASFMNAAQQFFPVVEEAKTLEEDKSIESKAQIT